MGQAYIVDAVRTAGGRRNGKLAGYHPNDLAAEILNALVGRSRFDPQAVEDVILGCVTQGGEQSNALGRNAVLASKLPQSVPAVTIDRQCGSSQQAIQFAAQAVMSDTQDVVIACGVESMSRVPMFSNYQMYAQAKVGTGPWSDRVLNRFGVTQFSQFRGAQMIAEKYELSRSDLDIFALESHQKAARATEGGAFHSEIVPVNIGGEQTPVWHTRDEGIRADATLSAIGAVKTLEEGGIITAANASQICDGASGVLIVNERGLKTHGLTPLARIHGARRHRRRSGNHARRAHRVVKKGLGTRRVVHR
jgi:acetyl-CoA C-acetyltransferase